jgi:hypothetical protein
MSTPDLLDYEKQAIRDFVDVLPSVNLPWRRPSFNDPTFWSEPLVATALRPLGGASGWTDVLALTGNLAYSAYVNGYVATTFGDATLSGVEFRLVLNGQLPTGMSIATNAELFKTGPAAFPVIPRDTSFIIRFDDRLQIQARNTNAAPRFIIAAFLGWYFDDANPAEKNTREGLTDA